MDLLFIEHMLHLSHVRQMYSQTMHLTHELKSWIKIVRRRVGFNGDSTVKDPCWRRVSNRDLPTQVLSFAASPSLQGFGHFHGSTRSGPFKWPVLRGTTLKWSPASYLEHSPDLPWVCTPWKSLPPNLLGLHAPATELGFGFLSAAPGVPKRSPIQVLSWPNVA